MAIIAYGPPWGLRNQNLIQDGGVVVERALLPPDVTYIDIQPQVKSFPDLQNTLGFLRYCKILVNWAL